jgi:hypothetical protein
MTPDMAIKRELCVSPAYVTFSAIIIGIRIRAKAAQITRVPLLRSGR